MGYSAWGRKELDTTEVTEEAHQRVLCTWIKLLLLDIGTMFSCDTHSGESSELGLPASPPSVRCAGWSQRIRRR